MEAVHEPGSTRSFSPKPIECCYCECLTYEQQRLTLCPQDGAFPLEHQSETWWQVNYVGCLSPWKCSILFWLALISVWIHLSSLQCLPLPEDSECLIHWYRIPQNIFCPFFGKGGMKTGIWLWNLLITLNVIQKLLAWYVVTTFWRQRWVLT